MRHLICAAVAAIALAAGRAEAYPQFQLSRDMTCTSCHLSPSGGGLLNENGRVVAETISRFGTDAQFMYGKLPLPSWLTLGGDLRGAVGYMRTPDNTAAAIPMQADIYARAAYKGLSLHVTAGARPAQWIRLGVSPALIDRFWSREHYLTWESEPGTGGGVFVRAGRFMPVFGLRLAEHPVYTRRYGGTPLYGDTYAAAVEYVQPMWEAHLTGFIEDPLIDTVVHDGGAALYGEGRLTPTLAVGIEAMVAGHADVTTVRGGLTAKIYMLSLDALVQAELQLVHHSLGAGSPTQLVGYAMGSKSLGHAFLLDVGLGHYDENLAIKGVARDALDVNLHWFATSHLELILQNRIEGIGVGASTGGPTSGWALLHAHYRL